MGNINFSATTRFFPNADRGNVYFNVDRELKVICFHGIDFLLPDRDVSGAISLFIFN